MIRRRSFAFSGLLVSFLFSRSHCWILRKPIVTKRYSDFTQNHRFSAKSKQQDSEEADAPRRRSISKTDSNLIDDGKGHVRGDLAASIWEWDHEHRIHDKNEQDKFPFSTRDGLRWVNEIAKHMLETLDTTASSSTSSSSERMVQDSSATSYSDLVQEGVVALLYAMTHYQEHANDNSQHSYESYTRQYIADKMMRSLASGDSRPIKIPRKVQSLLRHARRIRQEYMEQHNGQEPTIAQVAETLKVPADKLELYQLVSGGTLSVEQTVEVYDPLLDATASFRDQDTWESQRPVMEEIEDEFEISDEGDDEMWVHQEQIAAPLRDAIPDYDYSPDRQVSESLMQKDVEDFLVNSLSEDELLVIRMRFGLGTSGMSSYVKIADKLGTTKTQVRQMEVRALEKLKESARSRSLEPYLDDEGEEDDVMTEDTV